MSLLDSLKKLFPDQNKKSGWLENNRLGHRPTQQKRVRFGTYHHSRGESKSRRKMAAKSNNINRKRCRHWKH